jgi:hypothetical protein
VRERELFRVERDDRRPRRERRQARRLVAVDANDARLALDGGDLLAGELGAVIAALEEAGPYRRGLGAMPRELAGAMGAKAPRGGREVDGLQQAGLAVAVVASDDVEPGRRLEIDAGEVPEVADAEALDQQAGHEARARVTRMTGSPVAR